jgi:type IV secretion system protein VirB2
VANVIREHARATSRLLLQAMVWGSVPGIALAQASPFMTGMTSLQANLLSWLTPVAIILVMVLGGMAMASRVSWGWCIGAIFGIAIAFGAPQIVSWIRGMFGV